MTLSKTKLCGNDQRNGRVLRNVLDCRGTAALAVDSGTFRIETRPCFAILWLRKTLRNVLDWRKSKHWR